MINILNSFMKSYIDDNFSIIPMDNKKKLPIILKNKFNYYEMSVLNHSCILIEILKEEPSIKNLKNTIQIIKKIFQKEPVLYYNKLSTYRRKSLISNRIGFIEENGQFYLPFIALFINSFPNYYNNDTDENTSNIFLKTEYFKIQNEFTPLAQLAFLYFLYNKDREITNKEFASLFDITEMSASRALIELYNHKLINYKIHGKTLRSKLYRRIKDPDYFKIGKSLLISPIKKIVFVNEIPNNTFISGLEALSNISMINPINYKVRAISYKNLNNKDIKIINNKDYIEDNNLIKLEIWKYNPSYFIKNNIVDILSLYSSMNKTMDVRIQKELEQLLRNESWYME